MSRLVLNLKREYFGAIRSGLKTEEYRLDTPYWRKRLEGKWFTDIELRCGYPKRSDADRIIVIPWRGYRMKTVTHPHFGNKPERVFAIQLVESQF